MSLKAGNKIINKGCFRKKLLLENFNQKIKFCINTSRQKIYTHQKRHLVILMSIDYWLRLKLVKKKTKKY